MATPSTCPRKCERPTAACAACGPAAEGAAEASSALLPSLLDAVPSDVLRQHLLPCLSKCDKKIFRLTCPRQRQLVNQGVLTVCVPGNALQRCPPGTRLGNPFPRAHALKAFDWDDASISDAALIRFLSASGPTLARITDVDVKRCHHVGRGLLAFLRASCPGLRRLAPSRWTDSAALLDIAQFPALEELDLGDGDSDIVTIDDLSLGHLTGLAPSLRTLRLARCRWVTDAAFEALARLEKLEELDLSHTDVGPRGLAHLARLPALRSLNLSGCRHVTDEALAELARMESLASLSLRGTMATNEGLAHLARLARLAHLDLGSKWELNDAGLAAVAGCPELKVLAAGSFNLVRPVVVARGLRKLEQLSFGGGFANKGLHLLFPLLNLKTLHVQGIDSVTDCVMRIIASQTQLRHLSLRSGYSLTSSGLRQLAPLSNLAVLSVGACPAISRASLEAFTEAHARLSLLMQGCCPLLADTSDALCAVAPEPCLPALAPCVRAN